MDSLHHLVRRGVEQVQDASASVNINMDDVLKQVPKWAFPLFGLTVLAYVAFYISIAYTYGTLLPLLSMVETATAIPIIRTTPPPPAYSPYSDEVDMDKKDRASFEDATIDAPLPTKGAAVADIEVLLAPQSFITTSFRRTICHLRAATGSKLARFHGLRAVVFYAALSHLPLAIVGGHHHSPLRAVVRILTAGLLSTVSTAVVHTMIAAPSTTVNAADGTVTKHRANFFTRIRAARLAGAFRTTALPHMAVTAGTMALFFAPRAAAALLHAAQESVPGSSWTRSSDVILLLTVVGTVVPILSVLIPAHIALVRLQASLLPADVDAIVPFDRSLGGREVKNMRAAWQSFDRAGVFRVMAVYVKFVAMEVTVSVLFVGLLVAQLVMFAGPAVREAIRQAREQGMEVNLSNH